MSTPPGPPIVQSKLTIRPILLREANEYVRQVHRHHPPTQGHRWSIAVENEAGELVGVAIIGRPVARNNDDGRTAEVLRVATDGTANAPSALYGAARRAAKAMGYRRILTYTLCEEPGTSLIAAGWKQTGEVKGRSWSRPKRAREDVSPITSKRRWEATL